MHRTKTNYANTCPVCDSAQVDKCDSERRYVGGLGGDLQVLQSIDIDVGGRGLDGQTGTVEVAGAVETLVAQAMSAEAMNTEGKGGHYD